MTRRSKLFTFGCMMPLLLAIVCAGTVYFRSDLLFSGLARLAGNDTDQLLEEMAQAETKPAVDWTVLNGDSPVTGADASSADQLPQPAVTVSDLDVVRVKIQNQVGQIDTKAIGVSKSAEIVGEDGQASYVFEYNEANLNEMLITTAATEMPAELKEQVILERVELKAGVMVISGQVNPGFGGWQPLGILTAVGSNGKSVEIVGIDISGVTLDANGIGPMQDLFSGAEQQINGILQDFAVISGAGTELPLSQIYLGDGVLQVVFGE